MPRFSLSRAMTAKEYWSKDPGLTALLVSLLLLTFVFLPLETSGVISQDWFFLVDVWVGGVILAGAQAVGVRRAQRGLLLMTLGITLAVLGLRLLSRGKPGPWSDAVASIISALVFGILTALVLARVLESGPVNRHRIFGAVAAFLLLGLVWAELFRFVDVLLPGSIGGVGWTPHSRSLSNFVYFSLTTLTTAGYGDILPVSLPARSLASFESMLGMLFPAVLIARLVSLSLLSPTKD